MFIQGCSRLAGAYAERCIQVATEGTPALSMMNSMYQPGGARMASGGAGVLICPPAWVLMARSTSRWELSKEWVVTPGRMMLAHLMFPACGVLIVMSWPYFHSVGAAVMTGRGPANR